ncbi:pyr operon leader peptide [Metakosakonia massiliensis]
MPGNLPGGSMNQSVRQTVSPRLKKGAGLPFFFPLLTPSQSPSIEGLFFAPSSGDNHESALSKTYHFHKRSQPRRT